MKIERENPFNNTNTLEEVVRELQVFSENVSEILNSGIRFADNHNGQILTCEFTDPDTDTTFTHSLNFVPTGYLVFTRSVAMIVYNGSMTDFFTKTSVTLRSDSAGIATILLF